MCKKCYDLAKETYPRLSDRELGELLMSATSFPFGQFETIERQLKELLENTDGSLESAIAYAHQKMEDQFSEMDL